MTQKRYSQFVSLSLAHAGELAYAEDAHGSFELLSHLNRFFRYITREEEAVTVKEEIEACTSYVGIHQITSPSGLSVCFDVPLEVEQILIRRHSILSMLDSYVVDTPAAETPAPPVTVRLRRESAGLLCAVFGDEGNRAATIAIHAGR